MGVSVGVGTGVEVGRADGVRTGVKVGVGEEKGVGVGEQEARGNTQRTKHIAAILSLAIYLSPPSNHTSNTRPTRSRLSPLTLSRVS